MTSILRGQTNRFKSAGVVPVDLGVQDAIDRALFPSAGNKYYLDPINGNDANDGKSPAFAFQTLTTAYAALTANQNDVLYFLGGATADNPAATITWSKNYTHLIGVSAPLEVGQRCRIVGTAANDLAPIMTISADGCIFSNIQWFQGKDANTDGGCVDVSGSRNAFLNCFFAGMGHATPAARAGSYTLKVTGQEDLFLNCAIGLDTITRAAANTELWISTGADRLSFQHCRFFSQSDTGTHLMVLIDGLDRWVEFENCIFHNFSVNWETSLSNCISDTVATTHNVYLRGFGNQLIGITGWADTVTHIYSAAPVPNAGYGISIAPTT